VKRPLIILLSGLLLGFAGFAVPYLSATSASRALEKSEQPGLEWLRSEFHLSPQEFKRISELHQGYKPECQRFCALIAERDAELQRLIAETNRVTPEIEKLLQEKSNLRRDCQATMLKHFYNVSQAMPSHEGKRYLVWVQKHTLDMASPSMNHPPSDVHVVH
jgi:hypothetical protein